MREKHGARGLTAIAAIVAAMALFAGCGSGDEPATPETGEPTAPAPSEPPASSPGDQDEAQTVNVKMSEFALDMPSTFKAGTYTFVAENTGQTVHALKIEGQGMEQETPIVQPGDSAELTLTLRNGDYEVYCPVGGHKGQGMEKEITVE